MSGAFPPPTYLYLPQPGARPRRGAMNNVRAIQKINERELELAVAGGRGSWHEDYADSAYIFMGGLPKQLTEGDVITIFSQYGEVLDINLPRDREKGERRGFGFLMYDDQRSTVLAVDNLNGAVVLGRTLRVDHVKSYKQSKTRGDDGKLHDAEEQSLNAAPRPLSPPPTGARRPSPRRVEAPGQEGLEDPLLVFKTNVDSMDRREDEDLHRAERAARKAERARIRQERAERHAARHHSSHSHSRHRSEEPHRRSGDHDREGKDRRAWAEDRRRAERHHRNDPRDGRDRPRRERRGHEERDSHRPSNRSGTDRPYHSSHLHSHHSDRQNVSRTSPSRHHEGNSLGPSSRAYREDRHPHLRSRSRSP